MSDSKKKALFVCLGLIHLSPFAASNQFHFIYIVCFFFSGNICRSPIAEAVFIAELKKANRLDNWVVDSAAIGSWHVGKKPDHRALATMKAHNLSYDNVAQQVNTN